ARLVQRVSDTITAELLRRGIEDTRLTEMNEKVAHHYKLYVQTNMLDTVMIYHINHESVQSLPSYYLRKLNNLLARLQ
ncbi:hypothetical protein FPK63_26985, partial [Acinetobacter baumannii]|nr:hypothetical protein [Acinetobacter baumannii]